MKKKTTWKYVTEAEYSTTKQLQSMGLTATKISKVTGRAPGTVQRIMNSTDMANYKAITLANRTKYRKPTTPVEEMDAPVAKATNPNSDLQRIAKALERLADAWEAAPRKKSIF